MSMFGNLIRRTFTPMSDDVITPRYGRDEHIYSTSRGMANKPVEPITSTYKDPVLEQGKTRMPGGYIPLKNQHLKVSPAVAEVIHDPNSKSEDDLPLTSGE